MSNIRCTYCGSHQHTTKYCPKTSTGSSNLHNRYCSYCGSREHDTKYCPKTWEGQGNIRRGPDE